MPHLNKASAWTPMTELRRVSSGCLSSHLLVRKFSHPLIILKKHYGRQRKKCTGGGVVQCNIITSTPELCPVMLLKNFHLGSDETRNLGWHTKRFFGLAQPWLEIQLFHPDLRNHFKERKAFKIIFNTPWFYFRIFSWMELNNKKNRLFLKQNKLFKAKKKVHAFQKKWSLKSELDANI